MKKDMDTIQFESRYEVSEVLEALQIYAKEHQADSSVKRLIDLLDIMEMEW